MGLCECGCRQTTQGGAFAPGHDQKLRAELEARVGGLLALRELVGRMDAYVSGEISTEDLCKTVRRTFRSSRAV